MYSVREAPVEWGRFLTRYMGEKAREIVDQPGIFICGGCLRSFFTGEMPSDVDIFIPDPEQREEVVDQLREQRRIGAETPNAITFLPGNNRQVALQIIAPIWTGQRIENCLDAFDFTITQAGYTEGRFYLHPQYFEHLACRNLVYNVGSGRPLSTLRRCFKYQARRFLLCDEQLLSIVEDIGRTINFDDPEGVAEHILGMDPDGARRIRPID